MPNKSVCYLHIGTEKTGSTTIQSFLSLRRFGLKRRGIFVPVSPGEENQMRLATYAMNAGRQTDLQAQYGIRSAADVESFRAAFAKNLAREISESPAETCVMSGEHCSSRLVEEGEVERLHALLSPLFSRIFVIVYLRRQDDFLLSSYSTNVKYGKVEPCSIPTPEEAEERYNYNRLLDRWARVFGRDSLIVRRFDRTRLHKRDVLEDFLEIIAPGRTEGLERPANENVSLDTGTMEWLRLFNKEVPFMIDGKINLKRGNIPVLLEAISKGQRFTIDAAALAAFMERFCDSNRVVAERYFDGDIQSNGDPLFGPAPDRSRRDQQQEPLNLTRSIEIAARVWEMKHQQVLDLRSQLEEARRKPLDSGVVLGSVSPDGVMAERKTVIYGDAYSRSSEETGVNLKDNMSQFEKNPFLCVVASQRSGTTALARTLGRSQHFFNFGEIFRIENGNSKTQPGEFFAWARGQQLTLDSMQTVEGVNAIAKQYTRRLSELAGDACPLIDIKFNAWQVLRPAWSWPGEEPFLLRWLKERGTAFIMIRRRDLTQQLLSEVIAWNSGVWHGATEKQLPESVTAPMDVVRAKARRIIMAERLFHEKLKDHPHTCFITYEELYDGPYLSAGVTKFLQRVYGIDPASLPPVPVEKNAGDKRKLVKNYAQIEAEVSRVCQEMGRDI